MDNTITNTNKNTEVNSIRNKINGISNGNPEIGQKQESEITQSNEIEFQNNIENIENNPSSENNLPNNEATISDSQNNLNVVDERSKNKQIKSNGKEDYNKRLYTPDPLSNKADKEEGEYIEEVNDYAAQKENT